MRSGYILMSPGLARLLASLVRNCVDALLKGNVPNRNTVILLSVHPDADTPFPHSGSELDDSVTCSAEVSGESSGSNSDTGSRDCGVGSSSSVYGSHYHLVHGCNYFQSRCPSAITKDLRHGRFLRRHPRNNKLAHSITVRRFTALLFYLGISGRHRLQRVVVNVTPFGLDPETGR